MEIRSLEPHEFNLHRELRLRALRDAPDSFDETFADVESGGQPCLVAILTFLPSRIPTCSLPILDCNFLSSSCRTSSFRNPRLITPESRFIYRPTSTNRSPAAKSGRKLFKELKVAFSIIVITENHLPLITTTHRMIQGFRKRDSRFSRHETSISPISAN